jgi:hypothetical protein
MTYYIARVAVGLNAPSWTSEGEILNIDRYALYPGPRHDTSIKFLLKEKNAALFQVAIDFLDQATVPGGFAYKDVVQPFVVSEWLCSSQFRVLRIKRNLTDVAFSMLHQGWHYPRFASRSEGDLEEMVIEGIMRADMALDCVPGEQIDYDDLMVDESVLRNALVKLYPNDTVQEFKYTDSFRDTGNTILQRRSSDQYKMLNEKVEELADTIRKSVSF